MQGSCQCGRRWYNTALSALLPQLQGPFCGAIDLGRAEKFYLVLLFSSLKFTYFNWLGRCVCVFETINDFRHSDSISHWDLSSSALKATTFYAETAEDVICCLYYGKCILFQLLYFVLWKQLHHFVDTLEALLCIQVRLCWLSAQI